MSERRGKIKSFIDNFWYYNKYKVLIGILVLIVIINTVSELKDTEDPDFHVNILSESKETDALGVSLAEKLDALLPDRNGDGTVLTQVSVYHYTSDGEGNFYFEEADGIHLSAEILNDCAQLYIVDTESTVAESGLQKIGEWADFPVLMSISEEYKDYSVFSDKDGDQDILRALS